MKMLPMTSQSRRSREVSFPRLESVTFRSKRERGEREKEREAEIRT